MAEVFGADAGDDATGDDVGVDEVGWPDGMTPVVQRPATTATMAITTAPAAAILRRDRRGAAAGPPAWLPGELFCFARCAAGSSVADFWAAAGFSASISVAFRSM